MNQKTSTPGAPCKMVRALCALGFLGALIPQAPLFAGENESDDKTVQSAEAEPADGAEMPVSESEGALGTGVDEGASPDPVDEISDPMRLSVNAQGDHQTLIQRFASAEGQVPAFLDALWVQGHYLWPSHCPAEFATPAAGLEMARKSLLSQDFDGIDEGADGALLAQLCQPVRVQPQGVANAWFYRGVSALLQAEPAIRDGYFRGIYLIDPTYQGPSLGSKVEQAFVGVQGELNPLTADVGANWVLNGLPQVDLQRIGAFDGGLNHIIQQQNAAGKLWSTLARYEDGAWYVGADALNCGDLTLESCLMGARRADVARWLRVMANQSHGPNALQRDLARALAVIYPETGPEVQVQWTSPQGDLRTWSAASLEWLSAKAGADGLGSATGDNKPNASPQSPPKAQAQADDDALDDPSPAANSARDEKRLNRERLHPDIVGFDEANAVVVAASTGYLSFRGVSFVGLNADFAFDTPAPLRIEARVGGGSDLGQQGTAMRSLLYLGGGLRFEMRRDLGLTSSIGMQAFTRGPDPNDPSIFIVEGHTFAALRMRKPYGTLTGTFMELGGGLAPGVWRTGDGTPESFGLSAWLLVGYERR